LSSRARKLCVCVCVCVCAWQKKDDPRRNSRISKKLKVEMGVGAKTEKGSFFSSFFFSFLSSRKCDRRASLCFSKLQFKRSLSLSFPPFPVTPPLSHECCPLFFEKTELFA